MKILIVHNKYLESGGEDIVVDNEVDLLKEKGHEVFLYVQSNAELKKYSFLRKMRFLFNHVFWSKKTYQDIKAIIKKYSPDVVHVHNTFLMASPSVYDACRDENIPVVQTLHNYRFMCINGLFFRNGDVCEDCLNKKNSGFANACYWHSHFLSFIVTRILKKLKTVKIDKFITLSEFSKKIFVKAGFDSNKIVVKPNFVYGDVNPGTVDENYAVFVGRLADYKGIKLLIEAFAEIKDFKLKIIGDGPLSDYCTEKKKDMKNVSLLGRLSQKETQEVVRNASFLIAPSTCYETFSRVVIEAFASGKPAVVSDNSAAAELVRDGVTGVVFKRNSLADLVEKIRSMISIGEKRIQMGGDARAFFEQNFLKEKNYQQLISIYTSLLQNE